MAGDAETGVTIHETVEGARRRADRRRRGVPDRRRRTTRAPSSRARPRSRPSCSTTCSREPCPTFVPQAGRRRPTRTKIGPTTACSTSPRPAGELVRVVRALSPHIGARAELARPARDGLARPGRGGRRLRAARGAARGRQADGRRRLAARAAVSAAISPARARRLRRSSGASSRRSAYADRALRSATARARRPRPRARPAARLRHRPARPHARPRDRDARAPPRPQARPTGARRAPARRVPARVPRRRAALRGGQRVRRARPPSAAASAPSRSRTRSCVGSPTGSARSLEALPEATPREAAPAALVPGLDRRDVVARARPRRGAGADARRRTSRPRPSSVSSAARSTGSRIRTCPAPGVVDRVDEDALAEGRVWPQSRGSQLVGLAVGSRAGRAHARPLRGARRQGDDARGRGRRRRGRTRRAPRELEANARRLGATNVRVVHADGRDLPRRARRASTARSSTRRAPASACSPPGPTCAGARSRCRAPARAAARRGRARPARRHGRLLGLHDQRGRERGGRRRRRRDGARARPDASGRVAARSATAAPEFLQTLPHVHGTSGFFVARLRVR